MARSLQIRILTALALAPALLLLVHPAAAQTVGDVVLSELLYHPIDLGDPSEEFVELHNRTGAPVDLDGWCFTDGIAFCFGPGDSIAPGAYALLAQDAVAFQAAYGSPPDFSGYTGKLSNGGETLVLEDAVGAVVDTVDYADSDPWPSTADGLGFSLEVIDPSEHNDTPRNWATSTDAAGHTAGAANSVAAAGLPPWISQVQHGAADPAIPIAVTAFVEDATTVSLTYLLDFGSEVAIPMLDDGLSGDGSAGDGTYGASIPGQAIGTLVRYRIEAIGPTGQMAHPRLDDTIVYRGTAVVDPGPVSDLPILHWFVDPADYANALSHLLTDDTEPSVLYVDGQLWDNVQFRVMGQGSRNYPKKHWKFIFPQGNDFIAPSLGITTPMDRFNLRSNWADKSHMREMLSYEVFEAAGVVSLQSFNVRLAQNGGFFGLYSFVEQPDGEWVSRVGLDEEGAHYKSVSSGACQTGTLSQMAQWYEKKSRPHEGYQDLTDFLVSLNGLTGPTRRDFIFDNVGIPAQINYLAATVLFHENDHMNKNYYLYRDTEGTGRWFMTPWDKDLTWGRNYDGTVLNDVTWADVDSISGRANVSPSHPLFGDAQHQKWDFLWNRCFDAFYGEPEVREMFFRRLRTLMDEQLTAPLLDDRIDELVAEVDGSSTGNEHAQDVVAWGQYGAAQTVTQAADLIKNDYLAVRRTHLFTTHRVPGEIPEAQSAGLPIVINELMYAPVGGTAHEFVELFNPSVIEAVDLSRWTIEGLGLTVPPGTVLLPQGYLVFVFDDTAFRAEYGSGIFVAAEYGSSLPTLGASVVLRDASGAEVDRVEYTNSSPWPTAPAGTGPSLELEFPTLDNADPGNWAASTGAGGTPGAFNSISTPGGPPLELYINEVLPSNTGVNQDEAGDSDPWIEIYNASPAGVGLGGMALTNDFLELDKWRFPLGTTLCSGCWILVWADDEPAEGPLHANFTLNPLGDSLILSDAALTQVDTFIYGTVTAGTPLGRIPDGGATVLELPSASPGIANRGAAPLVVNEFNAVSDVEFLRDGGSDSFWGTVLGNGGDWIELVVTVDHLDVRGWQIVIVDDAGGPGETTVLLTLSQDTIWSDLRAGTIITISEDLADDVSYDPLQGDWWINVQAADGASGTYITAGDFELTNTNTQITIFDSGSQPVFGPVGEGIEPVGGVGSTEVFKLEEDLGTHITPLSNYNDGSSSTFGSANVFAAGTTTQDFTALRSVICFSDLDCNDANVCNGVETCDIPTGACIPGSCGITQVTVLDDDFEIDFGNWSNVGGDDIDWTRDSGGTPTSNTGPSVDHTLGTGAGFYLYTEASGNGTGYPNKTALLQSPCIDLASTTDADLDFWYHMFGTVIGTLYVEVAPGCGASWTTELTLAGAQQATQGSPYLQANVDLSAYLGTNIRLRFRGVTGSGAAGDMAIDDAQVTASALICGCDDGTFCNGQETCSGSTCVAGSAVDCEDGLGCTTGTCNEGAQSCDQVADDLLCGDGNNCNGVEVCDLVLGCQPTGCDSQTDLINQGFDTEAGEFAYQDDTFRGTANPTFADGTWEAAGGQTGGGLRVLVGGNSTDMSGGWVAGFNVVGSPLSVDVQVSFRVLFSGGYEPDEFGEALLSVDGTLVGVVPNDYLFQQVGDGTTSWDSGWLTETLTVSLADGPHQIALGAYNNKSTVAGEVTEVFFDDVVVTSFFDTICECDDGDVCNGAESCNALVCDAGTALDCDDLVACTADSCDAVSGCQNVDACTGGEVCNLGNGLCEPKACSGDPECGDGLFCNGVETCVGSFCTSGSPVACDDGISCTFDACNDTFDACEYLPDHSACQNFVFCDGIEICDPLLDCQPGAPEACNDGVGCTADSCNGISDACENVPDDNACENGQFCDGTETCHATLDCQAGTPVDCDDGVGCTLDACNEATDVCDNPPDDGQCQNGFFCDGAETCDALLDCQPAGDPCSGLACNENIDFCLASGPTSVILNEYNGVAPGGLLKNGSSDVFWGIVVGNGGDWFELVVTVDHLDMRGFEFVWSDDGDPVQVLTLTNDALWSDLRAGTIITVSEDLPDDVSYSPVDDDWWINVQAEDTAPGTYITASDFEVSNHDWHLFIVDAGGSVVFGPAGEGINPLDGIGSDEIFKLEQAPSTAVTAQSNYNDGSSSTFGAPNVWSAGTVTQDFSALRPNFPRAVLNEYNAVAAANFLGSGNSDTYWGRIAGNGGDWIELVVIRDHEDMRGWEIDVVDSGGSPQTLTLTNDPIWSDVRAGTIITVSEILADDVGYDPVGGDWWINVQAADGASGTYITASDFEVSNSNTQVSIRDAGSLPIFGPAGEGIFPSSGVGTSEVLKLEEDPGPDTTPFSSYNDGDSSSFGSPNIWSAGAGMQDLSALRNCSVDADCADALFCNGQETCVANQCVRTPLDCDDGVGCTLDSCDEGADSCENLPDDGACGNGAFCDGLETCDPLLDCQPSSDPCPGLTCDEANDICATCNTTPDCDDGVFCNGTEACVTNACVRTPISCDDGVGCTVDSCDEAGDACDNALDHGACDNAVFCDGIEFCDPALDCQAGPAQTCDDGVSCTIDACNVGMDTCENVVSDAICDNGLFCDGSETCDAVLDCQTGANPCIGLFCDDLGDVCVPPPPAPVILNEYSAVSANNLLKNGGTDTFWGSILGNGGDWFELVVTIDHQDLRGWELVISNAGAAPEVLTFSNDSLWADIRSGTIITVSEDLADDVSYDPVGGDWWINVQAADAGSGAYITAGDFPVSNSDWQLTIRDGGSAVVFGPAGEGIHPSGGVGSDEVFKLEEDPSSNITPLSLYTDGTSSTFGAPNVWNGGANEQDFRTIRECFSDGDCDDGLFCTGAETCNAGTCAAGTPVDCDDAVGCTADSCNEASDSCESAPNDASCDDADVCTGAETCDALLDCQAGTPLVPDDGVACTDDSCDPITGVANVTNDANCDDADVCTGAETCDPLLDCQAGTPLVADDGVACTIDSCDPITGVANLPDHGSCSDANVCTGVEVCDPLLDCQAGTPLTVDDGVGCTDDSCDPITGVANVTNDASCDDADVCTGTETCDALLDCQAGTPLTVDDSVACTDDSCDPITGVANVTNDANCDDADVCTGTETCDALLDCQAGTPLVLDDGVGCTDDSCDPITGVANVTNDANCDDADVCTGTETCDALLDCQAGTPLVLDDAVACTDDSCDPITGVANVTNDANCDDADVCTGTETCDALLDCQAGTPLVLDDSVACTDDSCDPITGVANVPNDASCDDADVCTGTETCDALLDCQAGTPLTVDDSVACTDDSCDPITGVANVTNDANCDDADICTGTETCDALLDCQAGTPIVFDDAVACTDDSCHPVTGAVANIPNDANCDDADICTGTETCDALLDCQAGTPIVFDDAVGCTDDSCHPVTGAVANVPNDANCDDADVCTGLETCDALLDCQAGTPLDPFDGFACTTDSCDPILGIQNVPVDSFCDNGDFCDGAEFCRAEFGIGCDVGPPPCEYVCDEDVDACGFPPPIPTLPWKAAAVLAMFLMGTVFWMERRRASAI